MKYVEILMLPAEPCEVPPQIYVFKEQRQAEDLHFVNKCVRKIVEMFERNIPQGNIGRNLHIFPFTVHNISKKFKDSRDFSE